MSHLRFNETLDSVQVVPLNIIQSSAIFTESKPHKIHKFDTHLRKNVTWKSDFF
jgi:hypothetical protein